MNGNEDDPEVIGVDGILEAYYASLQRVELFGPTLFAPVIKKASALAALTQSYDPMYENWISFWIFKSTLTVKKEVQIILVQAIPNLGKLESLVSVQT